MMSSPPKLRIALVGTGGWSSQHARYLASSPEIDFVAVVGHTATTTNRRAAQWETHPYLSVPEMIALEQPDLIVLSLPNQLHYERTMEVIAAGVPLVVEKPLAFDLTEAARMVQAAADRQLFFAIDFNHRYAQPIARAKSAILSGSLGDVVFATWRFGGEGTSTHPHGNLIETQCHAFDTLEHLVGPIASVMAEMTDVTGKGYSTHSLALRFTQGAVGSLLGSYDSSYAYPDSQRLEINGTRGRVVISDTVRRFEFQALGSETAEVWQAGYFNDRDREFHRTLDRHWDRIIAAFRAGSPPPVPAAAGYRALQLAHAAIASFEQGRRVETPVDV